MGRDRLQQPYLSSLSDAAVLVSFSARRPGAARTVRPDIYPSEGTILSRLAIRGGKSSYCSREISICFCTVSVSSKPQPRLAAGGRGRLLTQDRREEIWLRVRLRGEPMIAGVPGAACPPLKPYAWSQGRTSRPWHPCISCAGLNKGPSQGSVKCCPLPDPASCTRLVAAFGLLGQV